MLPSVRTQTEGGSQRPGKTLNESNEIHWAYSKSILTSKTMLNNFIQLEDQFEQNSFIFMASRNHTEKSKMLGHTCIDFSLSRVLICILAKRTIHISLIIMQIAYIFSLIFNTHRALMLIKNAHWFTLYINLYYILQVQTLIYSVQYSQTLNYTICHCSLTAYTHTHRDIYS